MKSSLIPDRLSPMKLLKRCGRGSWGSFELAKEAAVLRHPPAKQGSVLALLHRLSNFSASLLNHRCWYPFRCSIQPRPGAVWGPRCCCPVPPAPGAAPVPVTARALRSVEGCFYSCSRFICPGLSL